VNRGRCEECVGGVCVKRRGNIVLFTQDFTAVDLVGYILVFYFMLAVENYANFPKLTDRMGHMGVCELVSSQIV
jgi:hypothetical protein